MKMKVSYLVSVLKPFVDLEDVNVALTRWASAEARFGHAERVVGC